MHTRQIFFSALIGISLLILSPAHAGLSCSELFETKAPGTEAYLDLQSAQKPQTRGQKILAWIQDLVRFGRPDLKSKDFEIWVAENKDHPPFFNRKELVQIVSKKMIEVMSVIRIAGFEFRYPLRIVIENSADSISVRPLALKEQQTSWEDHKQGPMVHGAQWVGIKSRSKKIRALGPNGSRELAILFTRANQLIHFIQNPFVVVHELAHTTENPQSHNSRYWSEARADFIAYAITGISELLIPGGLSLEIQDQENNLVMENQVAFRSLIKPTVTSVSQVVPRYSQYHHNSQPISAALYELAQLIGEIRVLNLIQWIDSRRYPATPDRTLLDDNDKGHSIYSSVATTIQRDLRSTGQVLESAIRAQRLSSAVENQALTILQNRGILSPN